MSYNSGFPKIEPEEHGDGSIDVISTSAKTADASPIVLRETERVKTKFVPNLVENDKSPEKSVSGKLIYEKKRVSDDDFPSEIEKISRKSIKVGEMMEISLNTTETRNLFMGLQNLYDVYITMKSITPGNATYTRIDSGFRSFQNIIQNDPIAARMIGDSDNFELVKQLLKLITQTDSKVNLRNSLAELESDNMVSLSESLNLERLKRIAVEFERNIGSSDEEYWQSFFKQNQWILSQIFSIPCTIFEDKAYVGGKGMSNTGGHLCDFIYQNKLTKNVALIEIKTPCTKIVGRKYRDTFSLSAEMSGSINQVLNYKDDLIKSFAFLKSDKEYEVFSPKCYVIIGSIADLQQNEIEMFENYRSSLLNVSVVTFDELLGKINDMIELFKKDNIDNNIETETNVLNGNDDLPF